MRTGFEKEHFFLPICVLWHCVHDFLNPSRDCRRFYVSVDCPDWRGLETRRALHVPTPPLCSNYSKWVFEGSFRHLDFTFAQSNFAFSAAIPILRVATDGSFDSFRLDNHVYPRKRLLAALRSSVLFRFDFMDIEKMDFDYSYNLAAVVMA